VLLNLENTPKLCKFSTARHPLLETQFQVRISLGKYLFKISLFLLLSSNNVFSSQFTRKRLTKQTIMQSGSLIVNVVNSTEF
jgi:hypothetical protein